MDKGDFRIRIFQPNVRQYRVSLFEGVGRCYPGRVDLCASPVLFGGGESSPVANVRMDYTHPAVRFGPFTWQFGLTLKGLVPRKDIVIICGQPKNLSMMWIALRSKVKRLNVIWWGHHKTAGAKKWRLTLRIWIMRRLAQTVLFYTRRGIEWYGELGYSVKHVFATENALDIKPMACAASHWDSECINTFKTGKGIDGKRLLLFCSRLMPKVRLDLAVRALSMLPKTDEDVELVVIGDGVMRSEYETLSKRLGVAGKIRWLGEMFDQEEMAPWFLSAKAFVYPGSIGLSIFHAFSYGLPVVTHGNANNQMPEFEAMIDGKTGMLFTEGDVQSLASVIHELLSDEGRRMEMAAFSKAHVFANYTMEKMIGNFCEAIEDAAAIV